MPNVAVILSGSGYLDGAEIREAVIALLALDQQGAEVQCFAPDMTQSDVMDHRKGEVSDQDVRNVLVESARIARGDVKPLSELQVQDFDALVMPGGFGVAKTLSDFAQRGQECSILPELQTIIEGFFEAQKPIGAICIAPAVLAAALKGKGLTLTIGDDADIAGAIEALGHTHKVCPSSDAIVDEANRVVSCSAYMREDALSPIAKGIGVLVSAVLTFCQSQPLTKVS